MNKKIISLVLIVIALSISLPSAFSETGGGTKIDCSILMNEGGNKTLLPSGNTGTVGKDVILGCMGLPGAFTGDTSLTISGSTGSNSIAQVFPFSNNVPVNPDGSTQTVDISIMILSGGSTDVAIDFIGTTNLGVNSTLWTFSGGSSTSSSSSSSSTSGQPSTSSSSSSSTSGQPSASSSGGETSATTCLASITQCKSQIFAAQCKSCCSAISGRKCKKNCKKKCRKSNSISDSSNVDIKQHSK